MSLVPADTHPPPEPLSLVRKKHRQSVRRLPPLSPVAAEHLADGLRAFAGIWDLWKPKGGGDPLFTCAVITVPANATVRPLHVRMPAILPRATYADWLNPKANVDVVFDLLRPAPDDLLERVRVNRLVNNSRVDTPDCVQAV